MEPLIRSHFGVPSESTRVRDHQERLKELEEKREEISTRLETSRAEQRRLQRDEYDTSRSALERRAQKALAEGEQAIELAQSMEGELRLELDLKEQELQLALAENQTLSDQLAQISTALEVKSLELNDLRQQSGPGGSGAFGFTPWSAADRTDGKASDQEISRRLLMSLRRLAGSEQLRPRQCLELVSEELCPGHLLVLDSAWRSADEARGFEYGDRLFELLWLLATSFREQKLAGAPDLVAGQQVFGTNSFAARESQTIENNQQARRERTFSINGKTVEMGQHLMIGVKGSENRTLRIHVCWDADLRQVVIGHCGRQLVVPGHWLLLVTDSCSGASGIDHIQQLSLIINQAIAFTRRSSVLLGRPEGIGLVVHGLNMLPAAELVLHLDVDFGHAIDLAMHSLSGFAVSHSLHRARCFCRHRPRTTSD